METPLFSALHFCYHGVIILKLSIKKLIAVVVGIVLNISGRLIAQTFGLPIWLDMTGTFVSADIAVIVRIGKHIITRPALFQNPSLLFKNLIPII